MNTRSRQVRSIEAEGFHHGAHEITPEAAIGQIRAHFKHAAAKVVHGLVNARKTVEAAEAVLTRLSADAERHWHRLEEMTGGLRPEIGTPILATILAFLAAVGETILLAPVMDGFGIGDPLSQFVTAATLVAVASGLLHLSVRHLTGDSSDDQGPVAESRQVSRVSVIHVMSTVVLTLFSLTLVVVLGWWRGTEMVFAAGIQEEEWARFLAQNETLTKVCVTLLTVGLPVFAAVAFDWGFKRLRFASEWRLVKNRYENLLRRLESTRKRHEAIIEKRDAQLEMLEQQSNEWHYAYLENHALGRQIGARRLPLLHAVLRIAGVIQLIALGCVLVAPSLVDYTGPRGPWLYASLILGAGALYATRALRAWDRPTSPELYRQRAVMWRAPAVTPIGAQEPAIHDPSSIKFGALPETIAPPIAARRAS